MNKEEDIELKEKHIKNETDKARFGRRMKMPDKGTENKEGHPYGDIQYASWEKFSPSGGGEK